ncbi:MULTISPECIES: hypothetical protein [Pseudoalteromonas]|uniref:Uncharacterized protein n=1 Tax=Pseudoalteromonas amylolytica TaxID=1859457 RepID=A0A1S1MNA7_9GAMM|nr:MULTISPECIES: hypothetical protein [Pseudoalteromonas]OHU85153.1 hypothetical protein BFC16_21005 [Pseudoalteromonas sp. JW3]OHU89896.1 hypothetical protein BET10_13970 [Pseudoalteromonas amylolytica]
MDLSIRSIRYTTNDEKPESFTTELELVDRFERLLDVFSHKKVLVEREFGCGYGIADAVMFNYKSDTSLLDLANVPQDWAYTLRVLPYRKNFDLDALISLSGASVPVCRKAMKEFIKAGYCVEKNNGVFMKVRQPRLLCTSICSGTINEIDRHLRNEVS